MNRSYEKDGSRRGEKGGRYEVRGRNKRWMRQIWWKEKWKEQVYERVGA